MKKHIKNTIKISGIIIGIGLVFILIGLIKGASKDTIYKCFTTHNVKILNNNNQRCIHKSADFDEFDKLQIDVSSANIEIIESDKYALEYCLYTEEKNLKEPSFSVNNNTLVFKDNRNIQWGESYVKIFVPKEKVFKDIVINANLGDIRVQNCRFDGSNIHTNFGNITVNGTLLGSNEISNNIGDINISTSIPKNGYSFQHFRSNIGTVTTDERECGTNFKPNTDNNVLKVTAALLGDIDIHFKSID